MLEELRMAFRYAQGLRGFLRERLTVEAARRLLAERLRARRTSFLQLVERAVYANRRSPYLAVLERAGFAYADLARLVAEHDVEGALERLFEAGVFISLDEFKGRQPIRRPGLHLEVKAEDFDNPLTTRHFEGRTGGSRGVGRRLLIDLDVLAHDAACHALFHEAFGLADRPMGVWRSVPPDNSGIKKLLMQAKLGKPVARWFTHRPLELRPGHIKYWSFTRYTLAGLRRAGLPSCAPEYTPLAEAGRVAAWLAAMKQAGTPAYLDTMVSSGVRVCTAARERGLDISGTLFRFGGEPLTASKAALVAAAGVRAVCHYSMSELGPVAMACANPAAPDDVHLLASKVALIQEARPVGAGGPTVEAFYLTTVLPSCPKIMLNVETDDYGVATTRPCGCTLGEIGFDRHLHTIRSYEKLTSEGISFLGSDLLALLEDFLPKTFGGGPTDYQFVEEEQDGLPRVSLLVSPRVGEIDEERLARAVLEFLGARSLGHEVMARLWTEAGTLRVARREPHVTSAGKVLPIHLQKT
jgi:hypothetical protein